MKNKQIRQVFHPSDFTPSDDAAFIHALRIALAAKAKLQLLHVNDPNEHVRWSEFPRVRSVLSRWGMLTPGDPPEMVAKLGLEVVKVQRAGHDPCQKINEFIAEHRPELVVLATHQRRGLNWLLHDSLAESIAREAPSLTLFVPRNSLGFVERKSGELRLRNVLIPIDKSPNPQIAVDAAALLARTLACEEVHFILLHAGPDAACPAVEVPTGPGWSSEVRTWEGDVVDHILLSARVDEADLIVMATRGHHGLVDALRGSTTERVVHGADVPVLAVPEIVRHSHNTVHESRSHVEASVGVA
jgi:nucleotide-binding universal stress UspA family protein